MSLMIGDKMVASIHYTLTNETGETLDSSEGQEPLSYLHGAGNIIPGLEQALLGKTAGASMQVSIAPAEAYGEIQPDMIQVVPRSAFQGVEAIEPGMAFESRDPEGHSHRIMVKSVEGDEITIDANHPLAGQQLNFDVQVVDVRDASDEEIAHGHVH
jgi:FKBP-type peptidyl-prolyl cis-trans isomerase SlyD